MAAIAKRAHKQPPQKQLTKQPMKERILDTAERLFYRHGIRATGVDTIAAEVGISKRTLYNHFPSKDALIAAYLKRGFYVQHPSERPPVEQILRAFDRLEKGFAAQGFPRLPLRQRRRRARRGRPRGAKDRGRLQGKPPPVVSRAVDRERRQGCGAARNAAGASGRWRNRDGDGARRSVNGAGGGKCCPGAARERWNKC